MARGGGLPREVAFVSLERAVASEEGLLTAVREALGLTEVDAPDFEALRSQLHGGDRLLLLHNFESVAAAAPFVPRLAATAGVRVLVTSQQVLDVGGERVVDLDPMPDPEGHRLFATLAQQRNAQWQPDDEAAMRDVLEATDGLPYLIELVAPVAPKRQLRQLADELKTHLTAVRARGKDALRPERHASVQACLEWATDRLPPEGRDALSSLAIFSGGFDAEAAEAVAGTPLESLDILVDASLLRFDRNSGRYSMLSTTRQFALERLDADRRKDLAARHARWFIEHLDRADDALRAKGGESQTVARRWIDAEWINVQQAIAHAEEIDLELFRRAVMAAGIYLPWTCRFSERVRLSEALLSRTIRETSPTDWARSQTNLGIAYTDLPTGDQTENLRKSIACYEAALEVWTEGDFPTDWASVQNNLGNAYAELPTGDRGENLKKAIACYEATLRIRTERDFPAAWATTQNNLGTVYDELPTGDRGENLAKSIDCYEAALRVWSESDYPADWAMTQNNLGAAYHNLSTGDRAKNLKKAIACYEAALRVRTERDFPKAWANTQCSLGDAYEAMIAAGYGPDREEAIRCFESAARGYAAVGLTEDAELARRRAAKLSGI